MAMTKEEYKKLKEAIKKELKEETRRDNEKSEKEAYERAQREQDKIDWGKEIKRKKRAKRQRTV